MNPEQDLSAVEVQSAPRESFLNRRSSRRSLLKGVVKGGIGALALSTPFISGRDGAEKPISPDIVSPEELSEYGIQILNTDETQLYIRKSAFEEFDIFKDAKEGKIKGSVIITLVDDDSLSWDAMGRVDDKLVRTLGLAIIEDPIKYVDENYDEIRKNAEVEFEARRSSYKRSLQDLKMLNDGSLSGVVRDDLDSLRAQRKLFPDNPVLLKPLDAQILATQERLKRIESGEEREILTDEIEEDLARLQQAELVLRSTTTRDDAIEYFEKDSPVLGMIGRPEKGIAFSSSRFTERQKELGAQLDEISPNWKDNIYIFVSVGGRLTPKPKDSFPQQGWYEKYKRPFLFPIFLPDQYVVDISDPNMRGGTAFVLRHELSHYGTEGNLHDERQTDLKALDSLAGASDRFQNSGDTSGYPFVFKNKHGITYARKSSNSSSNA